MCTSLKKNTIIGCVILVTLLKICYFFWWVLCVPSVNNIVIHLLTGIKTKPVISDLVPDPFIMHVTCVLIVLNLIYR